MAADACTGLWVLEHDESIQVHHYVEGTGKRNGRRVSMGVIERGMSEGHGTNEVNKTGVPAALRMSSSASRRPQRVSPHSPHRMSITKPMQRTDD